MNADVRLAHVLTHKLGIEVSELAIGHETMWIGKSEVDPHLIESEIIEQLGEMVTVNSASYETDDGTYYLLICVKLLDETIHEIWLVNDEVHPDFLDDLK